MARPRTVTDAQIALMRKLRSFGWAAEKIARHVGVTRPTVMKYTDDVPGKMADKANLGKKSIEEIDAQG